jgi:hypothetical protein
MPGGNLSGRWLYRTAGRTSRCRLNGVLVARNYVMMDYDVSALGTI